MLTKENLAEKFKGLTRVFPGIPSYQEREGLRTQDKLVRAFHVNQVKAVKRRLKLIEKHHHALTEEEQLQDRYLFEQAKKMAEEAGSTTLSDEGHLLQLGPQENRRT